MGVPGAHSLDPRDPKNYGTVEEFRAALSELDQRTHTLEEAEALAIRSFSAETRLQSTEPGTLYSTADTRVVGSSEELDGGFDGIDDKWLDGPMPEDLDDPYGYLSHREREGRNGLETGIDVTTDFARWVSDAKDATIAATGTNPVSGRASPSGAESRLEYSRSMALGTLRSLPSGAADLHG